MATTDHTIGAAPPWALTRGPIVLVHGAWVGEWSWLPITERLADSGRPVFAVTLTGHGARRDAGGPHVTLSTHVADVVGLIESLDLSGVTLVAHSYGGRVASRVVAEVGERLDAVVFLDAHAPVAPEPPQPAERLALVAANGGMLPFAGYDNDLAQLPDDASRAWFVARLDPQSFACFQEDWQRPLPDRVRKVYVFATANPNTRFGAYAEVCRDDPSWSYHEIDGPHFLMFSHPDRVTSIVLDA